jgi:hypothetical protein
LILENIPLILSLPLSLYNVHQPLHPYSYLTQQLFYSLIDKEKSCFCFFKIYYNSPALPLRLLPRPKLLHQILFLLFVPFWLNIFSLPFFSYTDPPFRSILVFVESESPLTQLFLNTPCQGLNVRLRNQSFYFSKVCSSFPCCFCCGWHFVQMIKHDTKTTCENMS